MRKKNNFNTKRYLQHKYLLLYCCTALFLFLATVTTIYFQLKSIVEVYENKLINTVEFNKNELLNELALQDFSALEEHLNHMREELQVNQIILNSIGMTFIANGLRESKQSWSSNLVKILLSVEDVHVFIASKGGYLAGRVEISYFQQLFNWVLLPIIKLGVGLYLGSLLIIMMIFYLLFSRVKQHLIEPLNKISNSLGSDAGDSNINIEQLRLNELKRLAKAIEQFKAMQKNAIFAKVASQVAHDIRSPLAAIEIAVNDLSMLPETHRLLLRRATESMKDIANNLLSRHQISTGKNSTTQKLLMGSLLESCLAEKRLELKKHNKKITLEAIIPVELRDLFVNLNETEFKRVLSNIINNSFDAIESQGEINLAVYKKNDDVVLEIQDNGKGIEKEKLPTLFKRGVSHKANGNGLGLAYAKEIIEQFGGMIKLYSHYEEETQTKITLPIALPPRWFPKELHLVENMTVVIVDDDEAVHLIWKKRFSDLLNSEQIRLLDFYQPATFIQWFVNNKKKPILFLIDYEFIGEDKTGLDIIEQLNIAQNSILVTSRSAQEDIIKRCFALQLKILPKGYSIYVPIKFEKKAD